MPMNLNVSSKRWTSIRTSGLSSTPSSGLRKKGSTSMKKLRELLDWEWYGDTNVVRLYLHLLLKAKQESCVWQGIHIPKGGVLTSLPMLSSETGMTVKQVRRALKILIEGTKVGTMRAGKMTIITVCEYDSYNDFESSTGQDEGTIQGTKMAGTKEQEEDVPPAPPLEEEQEKEKNKKKILSKDNIKEKQKEESFVAPEFAQVFALWKEYKRQRKESYKSQMSLKICYNKLVKLSGNNPDIAVAIVEQSIANNWAGLFELKQNINTSNHNNGQQQNYINDPVERRQYERARRLQSLAARLAASQAENSEPAELPF